jgi:diguanylate cyclase (GGDEF)-like protein
VLDVDSFKNINDTYGHLAGDHILKAVASIARETVRSVRNVIRWGGEEFRAFSKSGEKWKKETFLGYALVCGTNP